VSIRNLDSLFEPRSVAIIGASQRDGRIGTTALANMAGSGYAGALWPVNPKYTTLHGVPCYANVAALPRAPELAILCTPPTTLPGLIAELGARGTRAAIVLTPVLDRDEGGERRVSGVLTAMLAAARPHLLRILGPGGAGLVTPAAGVNASLTHANPSHGAVKAGKIAFVSQSGSLMMAVLDWARLHGIGFSRFISLGRGADIDIGDVLDYLASDSDTHAILLYLEDVAHARKFMSAARLAARAKPVIVLKAGRGGEHGDDAVYDAAIRRAGMLRVASMEDLFDAAETLARMRPQRGERLAIFENGSALGLMAADALRDAGGTLATLSPDTVRRLRRLQRELAESLAGTVPSLRRAPHPRNPYALDARVPAAQRAAALAVLLRDTEADALLLLHAASADSTAIAEALAPLAQAAPGNVLSCWLGGGDVAQARQLFADAGLPTYDTPEKAVRGFMQIVQYRRNQALLMEVPAQPPAASRPERAAARAVIDAAIAAGHGQLGADATQAVLAAYGVAPSAPPQAADCDGDGLRLHVGVHGDPVFGPVIRLGSAVALPPLNMALARDLLARTDATAGLAAPQRQAAADAVCATLVRVAELAADVRELARLDIEARLSGGDGAPVLRVQAARFELGAPRAPEAMAIRAYPQELEQDIVWRGAPLTLRPIRPEDAPQHVAFFSALTPDDIRLRFFSAMRELPPAQLARLTQIDYDRAMAFIATRQDGDGKPETLGVVRAVVDPDNLRAEFAILIRSDLKGQGLGAILFEKLIAYFRSRGTAELVGEALSENNGMQGLVKRYGGVVTPSPEAGMVSLLLKL